MTGPWTTSCSPCAKRSSCACSRGLSTELGLEESAGVLEVADRQNLVALGPVYLNHQEMCRLS